MKMLFAAAAALTFASWSAAASGAEPWSDADPPRPPERLALGQFGLRPGAEYRANWLYVNPIALNSESDRRANWIEHRLRLDATLDYEDVVRVTASADLLDGVLWGDNGDFGEDPGSNAGTNVSTKNPNVTTPCVAYREGDPLTPEAYGYGLCAREQFTLRRLYGEVVTPIGLLRVGRQPVSLGNGVQSATGDGRANRFGISRSGNSTDRILFATKPLEAFKPAAQRDKSETNGVFFILGYDRIVSDSIRLFGDDVHQGFGSIRLHKPRWAAGEDLVLASYYVHRFDGQYDTHVNTVGLRATSRFGAISAGFDVAANLGSTREVSQAYAVITSDPVVEQAVRQLGARAVVRYDRGPFTAYLEGDFASGDGDPQAGTPLTQFVFAEDSNVGLLLFEHVLGFQTARAAAASVEILRRLGANSYPAEAVNTRGAFTNAFALFPQVDVRPIDDITLRGGVLMAWAPSRVVDPVASLQARAGASIEDDLVNFAGGKPAQYYGTEIDGRFQWRFRDHFAFDLEGAVLFPGAALEDENDNAVHSVLVQGRTTFFF